MHVPGESAAIAIKYDKWTELSEVGGRIKGCSFHGMCLEAIDHEKTIAFSESEWV